MVVYTMIREVGCIAVSLGGISAVARAVVFRHFSSLGTCLSQNDILNGS